VDKVLWAVGARYGFLGVAIRPLAQPLRMTAGALARDLAKAAGSAEASAPDSSQEGESEPDGSETPPANP